MEAKTMRARAREDLAGNWGVSIAIAVVASLLGGLITGTGFLPDLNQELAAWFPVLEEMAETLNRGYRLGNFTLTLRGGIFGFAAFVIGGVLQLGYADFLLKQHDGKETNFNGLFSRFDSFSTGFAQRFLRSLYIGLWSLLFVIPGIIKNFSYAMTPFILEDHPELTAKEAIRRSMELMDGHKGELFMLGLTFLGWEILNVFTLGIGSFWLNPYKNAAYAAFYRELVANQRESYVEF